MLTVGGCPVDELAAEFGTPLYVYDAATLRARARAYSEPLALRRGGGLVAFAAKACGTVAVLRVLGEEGLGVDASSRGRARGRAAPQASTPSASSCTATRRPTPTSTPRSPPGVACWCSTDPTRRLASPRLRRATDAGSRWRCESRRASTPAAHAEIATGGSDSKFGFTPAARGCRDSRRARRAAAVAARAARPPRLAGGRSEASSRGPCGWLADFCDAHGARSGADRPRRRARDRLRGRGRPRTPRGTRRRSRAPSPTRSPHAKLVIEPGRSVAGPAGITLYTVQDAKTAADGTRWVAIDGGMSDNPRPQLYGARYTVAAAGRMDDPPLETRRHRGAPLRVGGRARPQGRAADRCGAAISSRSRRPAPTASRWRRRTTSYRARPP